MMKRRFLLALAIVLALGAMPARASGTKDYGDVTLSGGFHTGHFADWWDLTAGDLVLSLTYDANGLVDDPDGHAWPNWGCALPAMATLTPLG